MIRKYVLFIILGTCMASCATPRFVHVYESPKGLDFSEGKWLVANVEAKLPLSYKDGLTRELLSGLRKMGSDSIYFLNDMTFKYVTPDKFKFELSPETLKILKLTTDIRFVVTSTARKMRDGVGDFVYETAPVSYRKSESEVCVAVYDVTSGTRIYYQRIVASVTLDQGDEGVRFARSAGSLLYNAMSKGLKDLKKYSGKVSKIRRAIKN